MAKGIKVAKFDAHGENGNAQVNQSTKPQTVTFPDSNSTSVTTHMGGVGGTPTSTTPLTLLVNYKTSDGTTKNDGFIVRQRGRKQFDVQSTSGGAATLTRATLVASGTLAASQMYIKAVAPNGAAFYVSRINNRFVWNGDTRYAYVIGNTDALTYVDSQTGVTFTNVAGDTIAGGLAVVEGA